MSAAARGPSISPRLLLITDPRYELAATARVIEAAASALGPAALAVQLRDKTRPLAELREQAFRLREVTTRAGALFIVNAIRVSDDNASRGDKRSVDADATAALVALAHEVGADGVHVACTAEALVTARAAFDGAGPFSISVPAHSDEDVRVAAEGGATAVLVSPIFSTPGKGPARGVDALTRARRGRLVVYALGGVTAELAPMCAAAGAHGVAVIRALFDADDPAKAARDLAAPFLG